MATAQAADPTESQRIASFEELGFTTLEASKLARGRDSDGFMTRAYEVEKALAAGCSHVHAVRIWGE